MNKTNLYTAMLITLFVLVLSINKANATGTGAYVYSINKGSPVVELDKYRVSTITRGAAANQPFKAIVQSVPKALFYTTFRRMVGLTGYGLAFLAAYEAYGYFYDDETENIVQKSSNTDYLNNNYGGVTGWCSFYAGSPHTYLDVDFQTCIARSTQFSGSPPINLKTIYSDSSGFYIKGNSYSFYTFEYKSIKPMPPATFTPVSDVDVFAALDDYIAANPNLNHNDMFKDQYGNPVKEMFPNPEYYENTQSDLDLAELYGQGLLQSTDPTADNYVTADEMARIKALYESLNKTPEQEAEDLTAAADKPITQTQHNENQLKAEGRAEEKAAGLSDINLDNLDKTQELDDQFNTLDSLITNPSGLPSVLPAMPQFNYSSSCQTIELMFGIVFPSASQCDKLGILKDMLAYFLYIIFAWLITTQLLKEAN